MIKLTTKGLIAYPGPISSDHDVNPPTTLPRLKSLISCRRERETLIRKRDYDHNLPSHGRIRTDTNKRKYSRKLKMEIEVFFVEVPQCCGAGAEVPGAGLWEYPPTSLCTDDVISKSLYNTKYFLLF